MAGSTRLELATSGVTGRRSNQLNYDPAKRRLNIGLVNAEAPSQPLSPRCAPLPLPTFRLADRAPHEWWAVQDSNL